jgi:hypothetical protein
MEGGSSTRSEQPLLSIDFVFEAGAKKLEEHQKLIDSLDLKMGVLVGLLGAFIVGLLATAFSSEAAAFAARLPCGAKVLVALGLTLVGPGLYFAFQAYRVREFFAGARFQDLLEWTNEETRLTKNAFLPTVLQAVQENEGRIEFKQRNARYAVWAVFLALVALWFALIMTAATLLLRR